MTGKKNSNQEQIVLVDENDNQIETIEKLKAHQNGGQLHRSFSIFVFNSNGKLMLQQRSSSKYHCGSLWTNTCCSHPNAGEDTESAAHRRLKQEMGFNCPLEEIFTFVYRAELEKGLTEHEFDHVFIGRFDGEPNPNPGETDSWRWVSMKNLQEDIEKKPQSYTPWFKIALPKVISHLKKD